MNRVLKEDLNYTLSKLTNEEIMKLSNSTVLITGCGGFLGQYYLAFFEEFQYRLNVKKVIGIDTFLFGKSPLIKRLENIELFDIRDMNIMDFSASGLAEEYQIDYVFHMASIASPTYYRKYPLETLDSNVWGLRVLLEEFKNRKLKGFLFYSSSEIYGNPLGSENIPTSEMYWGNVSCIGPRACYDEAKRFGETLCYYYEKLFKMPLSIVRLFNVYGPGLNINDRRAPADFANAVINNKDIIIYSDGSPTRTFCYVADSAIGEIKALLNPGNGAFNIGMKDNEITIVQLANEFKKVGEAMWGYSGKVRYELSDDIDYLTHDPARRCPKLDKVNEILNYYPVIDLNTGIKRYLEFLKLEGENVSW